MKSSLFFTILVSSMLFMSCNAGSQPVEEKKNPAVGPVTSLTNDSFKSQIFNYEVNKQWKYEGDKPAIIDFYADWCNPCRQLSPIVEEIAKEYEGKIVVYKVDTQKEQLLAQSLGITGLPTLLFIPAKGEPQISVGLLPKESLIRAINEVLLIK